VPVVTDRLARLSLCAGQRALIWSSPVGLQSRDAKRFLKSGNVTGHPRAYRGELMEGLRPGASCAVYLARQACRQTNGEWSRTISICASAISRLPPWQRNFGKGELCHRITGLGTKAAEWKIPLLFHPQREHLAPDGETGGR
jgi:hypothetical protein